MTSHNTNNRCREEFDKRFPNKEGRHLLGAQWAIWQEAWNARELEAAFSIRHHIAKFLLKECFVDGGWYCFGPNSYVRLKDVAGNAYSLLQENMEMKSKESL